MPESNDDARLELKLVGDITGEFRVPAYQRGYRWTKTEVTRLLDDIVQNGDRDYSLQPIVVKRDGEASWELVDGQQRLTTLYLIFTWLHRNGYKNVGPQYSVTYDTRPESREYLSAPGVAAARDNIDFFHLHAAYESIQSWFETNGPSAIKRQELADDVFRYLCKRVRVIWYEAPRALDSAEIFTRLNVGRIALTDAELFKALLLSHHRRTNTDRAHEIAAQWDGIERDLRQPELWAFITDDREPEHATRITLLLDAVADKRITVHRRERPPFHTFDTLRTKTEETSMAKVWNEVLHLHALVLGWYENRDHFHKIGWLVAQGKRFNEIVALAEGKTKSELEKTLDDHIRQRLNLTVSDLSELGYETNRSKCEQVLSLMNVETMRGQRDSTERYSFRAHRRERWSLEHIHAQHAEGLTRAEQWREWLRLHRDALVGMQTVDPARRDELVRQLDVESEEPTREGFERLARELTEVFSAANPSGISTVHSLHALSNLALIASGHNSVLSNSVFEVKRRKIVELDRNGEYIPVCTRRVFLKYYTVTGAQQVQLWSQRDRECYLAAIASVNGGVGAYLTQETEPT